MSIEISQNSDPIIKLFIDKQIYRKKTYKVFVIDFETAHLR